MFLRYKKKEQLPEGLLDFLGVKEDAEIYLIESHDGGSFTTIKPIYDYVEHLLSLCKD